MRRIEHGEDVEPEDYLDVSVTEWLPRRWECPDCERALDALAPRFAQRHGDPWLRDLLAAKRSTAMAAGLQALADAARANLSDESDRALARSKEAAGLFLASGSTAGRLRAEFEQAYALHRSVRSAAKCLQVAAQVEREAGTARYLWIHGQAILEEGNCRSLLGDSGAAHNDMDRALMLAGGAGYRDLALRAASILTDARTEAGNLLAAWKLGREGLAEYWTGAYSGIRAHQICLNLARSADGLGLPQAAYVLEKAAVTAISATPRRRTEAAARSHLADLAAGAGRQQEAEIEFDRAAGLFQQMSQSTGEYRTLAELYRAKAEAVAGAPDAALRRLEAVLPSTQSVDAAAIQINFQQTFGELLRLNGRRAEAEESYRQAIRLTERQLATFQRYRDRARFLLAAARAYRGLTGLLWDGGDTEGALRVWEWFRTGEAPGERAQPDLERRRIALRNESFLTFAELPGGFVAWVYDDRGITGRRLVVRPEELEATVSRFLRECADRESDRKALQGDARRLYDWLIAPLADRLDPSRTLIVEPDGAVGAIPIQALMEPGFHYVGERFAIAVASSLADYQHRAAAAPITAGARALVVADPRLGGEMARAFPPLPGTLREGQAVAERFRRSVPLVGLHATAAALEQHRDSAEVFHFAGHGFSNAGNGGLLLSPDKGMYPGAGVLDGPAMEQQDWGRCRLAVLSACSTGTGEASGPVNPESLVRGFLWAGVARVVAVRWNLDSQTGVTFMDQFYSSLLSGHDTAAALQHAAQRLRQDGATSHPYFWAGFQGFGTR